jgi:hypothetical protein
MSYTEFQIQYHCFVKVWGHAVAWKETLKYICICKLFGSLPDFPSLHTREVISPYFFFTNCGEPLLFCLVHYLTSASSRHASHDHKN